MIRLTTEQKLQVVYTYNALITTLSNINTNNANYTDDCDKEKYEIALRREINISATHNIHTNDNFVPFMVDSIDVEHNHKDYEPLLIIKVTDTWNNTIEVYAEIINKRLKTDDNKYVQTIVPLNNQFSITDIDNVDAEPEDLDRYTDITTETLLWTIVTDGVV